TSTVHDPAGAFGLFQHGLAGLSLIGAQEPGRSSARPHPGSVVFLNNRSLVPVGTPMHERARMGSSQQVRSVRPRVSVKTPRRPIGYRHLHGSDFKWAVAFVAPYVAVFVAFVVHPAGYALWMASDPALYVELAEDPLYLPVVVNTLLFTGLGVNVKMFLAL